MKRIRVLIVALATAAVSVTLSPGVSAGPDVAPGQTGFEPTTAAVNPQNPSQVAVMRGCLLLISNDFGRTFPVIRNTTLAACNGDPSIAYDAQGRLFVSHLANVGGELTVFAGQVADTTTAGTLTYTPIQVSTTDGMGDDKQWLAADANPASPFSDNLYLVWQRAPTIPCNFPNCAVLYSRSVDQGANWSAPQVISANGEGFVWPPHVAVGPNGDVYAAYPTDRCGAANAGTTQLLRDGNGGANFAAGTVPQKATAFAAGEATITCNVQDGSGDEIPGHDSWQQGAAQPWILPDPVRAGNVYVVGNDDPDNAHGTGDDGDVVIARSTNFGVDFTVDRVDSGPLQSFAIMPTAAIDQDGNIAVHWYDNRRGLTNRAPTPTTGTRTSCSTSTARRAATAGRTFANDFRISDAAFDPDAAPTAASAR